MFTLVHVAPSSVPQSSLLSDTEVNAVDEPPAAHRKEEEEEEEEEEEKDARVAVMHLNVCY